MRSLVVVGLAVACAFSSAADTAHEAEYLDATLGVWSTEAQSSDEAYDWVGSHKWRILPEEDNGVWVYQENTIFGANTEAAPAESPAPYFQVAIHFRDLGDGLLHTTTYRVADRAAARGFATGQSAQFDRAWLGEIACMGQMQRVSVGFWSGAATCPNGYKGGVKVESRSVFAPGYFVNWDRGFDANGDHIWGPASGGYIFEKIEDEE